MALTVTERWICERVNLQHNNLDDVKSLSLPGSYHQKISHLGNALRGFTRLKHLDLSRNDINVIDGLDHLKLLESLNLYYNSISSLKELQKLRHNSNLKEIDLRLNPLTKNEPDYRLFVIHMIPNVKILDDRSVRDSERKAALSHFTTYEASQFEETPPKPSSPEENERHYQPHRAKLVQSLASAKSVLEDDDVALIDLVSNSRLTGSDSQIKQYRVETYDAQEIERLPSPHAKRYGYELLTTSDERSVNFEYQRQNKRTEIVADPPLQRSYRRQNIFVDDHPFMTNGNFTPNPGNGSRNEVNKSRYMEGAAPGHSSFSERHFLRKTRANEERSFAQGQIPQDLPLKHDSSHNERKARFAPEHGSLSSRESNHVEHSQYTDIPVAASEKSMSDKREQEQHDPAEKPRKQEIIQELSGVVSRADNHTQQLLMSILILVDKYWNGSGSLQTNAKFQAVAEELISKFLHDDSNVTNEAASSLEKRDKDLLQVQNRLTDQIAENERLKKRLQNEDEIKRTIELTDKDLRKLQTKVEEVQAENKALKLKASSVETERKAIERIRAEAVELEQGRESLERDNQTLAQQCEQQATTLAQLQELTSMLQESHRSLVVTNDHLLHELDEARQRHQHEIQQLHWSYEQLKKTADWMPRSAK